MTRWSRRVVPTSLLAVVCLLVTAANGFTLLTFDVDGTLVKGSGQAAEVSAHARSFSHAVGTVLGDGSPVAPVAQALHGPEYHGSTDGLILLRLARATLGIQASESAPQLEALFQSMYDYIMTLPDEEVARGITPLPGVLDTLHTLAREPNHITCGLVTGNVEGIAVRKMKAVGIYQTGALAPAHPNQRTDGFLGGFGTDFCSGNIDDLERNHLDRSEQIGIAVSRCKDGLKRVVHVGDAPADVLAAKAFASRNTNPDLCVGCVGVATGSYSAEELRSLAGERIPGRWEPVVLEDGIADPTFREACGLPTEVLESLHNHSL